MSLRNRSLGDLARDLLTASKEQVESRQAVAALDFLEEFSAFSDQPEAFDELLKLLEREGEGFLTLLKVPLAELGLIPIAILKQHAVGKGGFHTGVLGRERVRLRWVYDCGAISRAGKDQLKVATEEAYARVNGKRRTIDLLFLSHFDSDHISGIGTLARRAKIETVVIPYLDELDRIAVLAHASATGKLTSTLVGAVSDLPAWFRGRGATRVVEIDQGGPGTRSVFVGVDPGLGPDIGDARFGDAILVDPQGQVVSLPTEGSLRVEAGSGWVIAHVMRTAGEWCFLPFVNPATDDAGQRLACRIGEILVTDEKGEQLLNLFLDKLKDKRFRKELKKAYVDADLGDSNAVSMSLYVGPFRDGFSARRSGFSLDPVSSSRPGWLLTGDAKLKQRGRRRAWLSFYRALKPRIGALMLAHHGSQHNFHEDVLGAVENDAVIFACTEPHDASAPLHEDVWPILIDSARRVHIVTTNPETALIHASGFRVLSSARDKIDEIVERWS